MEKNRWSHLSRAKLEAGLADREAHKAALTAEQAEIVAELDRRQAAAAAGCRTLQEWVRGRVDVDRWTARRLVALSRLDHPDIKRDLADGEITADRALAEARLSRNGADERTRRASRGWDVDGVNRLADRHRRLRRCDEQEAFERRYLTVQPRLDHSAYKLDGELPGLGGRLFADVIDEVADRLPVPPDGRDAVAQRRADALVQIAMDAAAPPDDPLPVVATVFVDAGLAAATSGAAGAEVVGGPRVGPSTLEAILCGGRVEVDLAGANPLGVGPSARGIPPRLRRFVIGRDGGACCVDGCDSDYRLQVHHRTPVSQGGTNDPNDLVTACWYHHIVVIHGRGYRIDPDSPRHRLRLLPPGTRGPPPDRG